MNQPKRRGRPPKIQPAVVRFVEQTPAQNASDIAMVEAMFVEDTPPWQWPKSPAEPLMLEPPHMMTWVQFAEYVRSHAPKVVRASYPLPYAEVIDTIYSGVPVIHGEPAVMDAQSNWTKL